MSILTSLATCCCRLPTKLRESNVFSRVCLSFCSRGWGGVPDVTIAHHALDLTIQWRPPGSSHTRPAPDIRPHSKGPPTLPPPTWTSYLPVQRPPDQTDMEPHCTGIPWPQPPDSDIWRPGLETYSLKGPLVLTSGGTVGKRAVHILLECFHVLSIFTTPRTLLLCRNKLGGW